MGNLSPEEILKRIEGDSKGKAKGNQKNGTNVPKQIYLSSVHRSKGSTFAGGGRKVGSTLIDSIKSILAYKNCFALPSNIISSAAVDHSSVAANGSRNSGGRKRGDKKERQTEKIAKRPVIVDREVVELSTKLETLNIKKVETVVMTDTNSEPNHPSLLTGTKTSKKEAVTTSSQDGKVEEAGSGAKITTKAAIDEGVDDEEQYLSADEGANSNVSDDIKTELQYHTDEQSGASGSRDFISDGANYRADDEEINPLPVTSEESEFIQVTTRSKRRGGGASSMQHQQQALSPGVERKNVYFNSMIDRGGRGNIRRDADRLRRSSVQLPPDDSRRNQQPSSRGNTSPSPVDSESFKKYSAPPRFRMLISEIIDNTLMKAQENKASAGKAQTVINSGIAQSRQQRQQQHLKPATSTSMGKKAKYGLPSSLQTSRTASPDRRSSQPLTLKYSVAAGSAQNDSSVVSLSEGLSDAKQKVTDQQINTVTVASANPPAQHSWADIAKRRLYSSAEVRPSEGSHAYVHGYSSDLHGSVKEERSVSTSSVSGHLENTKKIEQTLGVEALSGDLAVKDYSFFFDPNEPAGTISKGAFDFCELKITDKKIEPGSSKIVSKDTEEDSKFSKPRCAGIVLNLDGGRQLVLPESDVITTTPATVIDIRQRPEVLIVNEMWRDFTEDPAEVVTYREYQRQREQLKNQGSSQKNRKEKVEK
uniref:Uncharacterized protein n=1 Tax=Setaria digitata TaxID=48799 RepID=A0A915PPX9_9BILA